MVDEPEGAGDADTHGDLTDGSRALDEYNAAHSLLKNAKHVWDYRRYLHPEARPTVVAVSRLPNYSYFPLIIPTGYAATSAGAAAYAQHTPSPSPASI